MSCVTWWNFSVSADKFWYIRFGKLIQNELLCFFSPLPCFLLFCPEFLAIPCLQICRTMYVHVFAQHFLEVCKPWLDDITWAAEPVEQQNSVIYAIRSSVEWLHEIIVVLEHFWWNSGENKGIKSFGQWPCGACLQPSEVIC